MSELRQALTIGALSPNEESAMQLQRKIVDAVSASINDPDHICGRLATLLRRMLDTAPALTPAPVQREPHASTLTGQADSTWPFNIHIDTTSNQQTPFEQPPLAIGSGVDPVEPLMPNSFAGLAQTSAEQDQLLSDFFGPPSLMDNETNLLGTLWNYELYNEFGFTYTGDQ